MPCSAFPLEFHRKCSSSETSQPTIHLASPVAFLQDWHSSLMHPWHPWAFLHGSYCGQKSKQFSTQSLWDSLLLAIFTASLIWHLNVSAVQYPSHFPILQVLPCIHFFLYPSLSQMKSDTWCHFSWTWVSSNLSLLLSREWAGDYWLERLIHYETTLPSSPALLDVGILTMYPLLIFSSLSLLGPSPDCPAVVAFSGLRRHCSSMVKRWQTWQLTIAQVCGKHAAMT